MSDLLQPSAQSVSPGPSSIARNRLLAELARSSDAARYAIQPVNLPRSTVLLEPDEEPRFVYFPTSSVLALVASAGSGPGVEVASIGREGMSGPPGLWLETGLGARLAVEIPGEAYVMSAASFRQACLEHETFRRAALRFSGASWSMILQSAACYRHHTVRQQCARWLLLNSARLGADSVPVTHDLLAELLGVFRPTISVALRELQDMGAIVVVRGRVRVCDRKGLEACACGCCAALRAIYAIPEAGAVPHAHPVAGSPPPRGLKR